MRGGGLFGFVFLFVVVLLFGGGVGGFLVVVGFLCLSCWVFFWGGWFSIQYFCYLILVSAVVYMSNPQAKLSGFLKYAHF